MAPLMSLQDFLGQIGCRLGGPVPSQWRNPWLCSAALGEFKERDLINWLWTYLSEGPLMA